MYMNDAVWKANWYRKWNTFVQRPDWSTDWTGRITYPAIRPILLAGLMGIHKHDIGRQTLLRQQTRMWMLDRMPRRSHGQCGPDLPYTVTDTWMRSVSTQNCKGGVRNTRDKMLHSAVELSRRCVTGHSMDARITKRKKNRKKDEKTRRWCSANNAFSSERDSWIGIFSIPTRLEGGYVLNLVMKTTLECTGAKARPARTGHNNQLELAFHKCSNLHLYSWDTNNSDACKCWE